MLQADHDPEDRVVCFAQLQMLRQLVFYETGLQEQASGAVFVCGGFQFYPCFDVVRRIADDFIKEAAGLTGIARHFGHAFLLVVQLLQHKHRQADVVLLETEQAGRVMQ